MQDCVREIVELLHFVAQSNWHIQFGGVLFEKVIQVQYRYVQIVGRCTVQIPIDKLYDR